MRYNQASSSILSNLLFSSRMPFRISMDTLCSGAKPEELIDCLKSDRTMKNSTKVFWERSATIVFVGMRKHSLLKLVGKTSYSNLPENLSMRYSVWDKWSYKTYTVLSKMDNQANPKTISLRRTFATMIPSSMNREVSVERYRKDECSHCSLVWAFAKSKRRYDCRIMWSRTHRMKSDINSVMNMVLSFMNR